MPPRVIKNARALITVKAYPLPSKKYGDLVCTAGILDSGEWVRVYPIPFRNLPEERRFTKFQWIELDLERNEKDFRPESYKPAGDLHEGLKLGEVVGTKDGWRERKRFVLREVFDSMEELLTLVKGDEKKSLATLKPKEIIGLKVEPDKREWKEIWRANLAQYNLWDDDELDEKEARKLLRKVPYKFSYRFLTEGDDNPRELMIEDWEIGQLYWNCLEQANDNEKAAIDLVRKKYEEEFIEKKDLHLFVGTTLQFHRRKAPNPFVIIGVFYPPKAGDQLSLFINGEL